MQLEVTDTIRALLTTATKSPSLSLSLKNDVLHFKNKDTVPYAVVKGVCLSIRGDKQGGPWLHEVCKGSRIILSPPPERKRSPELIKRLEQLKREQDEREYRAMVKDVDKGSYEDTSTFNLLPSFRLQLSFGAHVLLTMFVFYWIGTYASRVFTNRPVLQAIGGVMGLTIGLILETTLFIIRSIPTVKPKSE